MTFLLLAMLFLPEDGVIVLVNGKTLKYRDDYKIEGNNIIFSNPKGDLLKLPLSMVDLPKTKQRVEARKAAAARVVKKTPSKKELSEYERFVINAKQTEEGEKGGSVIIVQGNSSSDSIVNKAESAMNDLADKSVSVLKGESCGKLRKDLVVAEHGLKKLEERLTEMLKENEDDTEVVTSLKSKIAAAKASLEKLKKDIETCDK